MNVIVETPLRSFDCKYLCNGHFLTIQHGVIHLIVVMVFNVGITVIVSVHIIIDVGTRGHPRHVPPLEIKSSKVPHLD